MSNNFFNKARAAQYAEANDLPPTCAQDIVLALADVLDENDDTKNVKLLDDWLAQRPYLKKRDDLIRKDIDLDIEREAFGAGATLTARATLSKHYGPLQYAERLAAWGASAVNLKPGAEPGKAAAADVAEAEAKKRIYAEDRRNPFNPKRPYKDDRVRQQEIASFIGQYGAKAAFASAKRFDVDIAGRPLRRA